MLELSCESSAAWEMTMTPFYAVLHYGDVVNITCQADVALAACGFKTYWDPYTDLSTDLPVPPFTQGKAFSYTALEQGAEALSRGRCGITFVAGTQQNVQNIGCRGRTSTGPWQYDYLTLAVDTRDGFPLSITPRHPPYILVGQEYTVLCKSDRPLEWCNFHHSPSKSSHTWHWFHRGQSTKDDSELFDFAGAGLEQGECGIRVFNATIADAEWVVCTASSGGTTYSHRTTLIPIATPPSRGPELVVPHTALSVGETLTAECTVSESRPPANITWYFEDRVVEGVEVPDLVFLWSIRTQGRKQTLTRKVTANDNGKTLRCVASHVAMKSTLEASKRITIGNRNKAPTKPSNAVPMCPPLIEPALDITCSRAGTAVSCTQAIPTGTVAYLKCKEGFVQSHYSGYRSITCTARAVWNKSVFKCVPDCGKPNPVGGVAFASNGEVSKVGEFPWHVGVYEKANKKNNTQICGGTMITSTIIISAAHCFWDNNRNRLKDKSRYLIAAGKYYRKWDADDEEVQRRNVLDIHVHERFLGVKRNYASDIAIIVVSEEITFTKHVNVVCIDWTGELEDTHLSSGNNGTVAGWGITENNTYSDVLMSVRLPYVPFSQCKDVVSAAFLPFLTSDKICGGWVNRGIAVCPGDSGGGYVFPQTAGSGARYYLRGIVSAGQRASESGQLCDTQQVASFTKVSSYRDWIETYVFNDDAESRLK